MEENLTHKYSQELESKVRITKSQAEVHCTKD